MGEKEIDKELRALEMAVGDAVSDVLSVDSACALAKKYGPSITATVYLAAFYAIEPMIPEQEKPHVARRARQFGAIANTAVRLEVLTKKAVGGGQ